MPCAFCGNEFSPGVKFCTECDRILPLLHSSRDNSIEQKVAFKGYIQLVTQRLVLKGFKVSAFAAKSVSEGPNSFVATREGKRSIWKPGMDRVIFLSTVHECDPITFRGFSNECAKFALKHFMGLKSQNRNEGLLCIAGMVLSNCSQELKDWITNTLPQKHWAAFEFPVLVTLEDRRIYYLKKSPMFGAVYYNDFRQFAEETFQFPV